MSHLPVEAILLADIVDATGMTTRLGSENAGAVLKVYRDMVATAAKNRTIRKHLGDGELLTFGSHAGAWPNFQAAMKAGVEMAGLVKEYNTRAHPDRMFQIRVVLHYGEVIKNGNDRSGNTINLVFRYMSFRAPDLNSTRMVSKAMAPREFPTKDYAIISQASADLLERHGVAPCWREVGFVMLNGFDGAHRLFVISPLSEFNIEVASLIHHP